MSRNAAATSVPNPSADRASGLPWRRRRVHYRLVLLCLVLLSASCSSPSTSGVTVSMAGDLATREAAAEIIRSRLDAVVGGKTEVRVTEDGVRLEVPIDTSEEVLGLVLARGEVTMRPVLGVFGEAEAVPSDGGILMMDQVGVGYLVGPPFVAAADFDDGFVEVLETQQHEVVLVNPTLTPSGGDAFTAATRTLAEYPYGDPRRQMVVAVDDAVLSAPAIAADVDPDHGLPADSIVFTIEAGAHASARARADAIAAYLRLGPLPVDLRLSD